MARGRIVVDSERCKGCELCRTACPPGVIVLSNQLNSRGYQPVFLSENGNHCTGCALCAVVCPEGAITVFREISRKRVRAVAT